jgi:hypothetical protein
MEFGFAGVTFEDLFINGLNDGTGFHLSVLLLHFLQWAILGLIPARRDTRHCQTTAQWR